MHQILDCVVEGQHFFEIMKLLHVDVFGIKGLNLNTACPHIHHDIVSTFKYNDKQAKLQLSTSPEIFPATMCALEPYTRPMALCENKSGMH